MQIVGASFVVICDEVFSVIKKGGILFENGVILAVDSYIKLRKNYPNANATFYDDCAITPALANLHLHLEFSQNEGLLKFGDFGEWLDSVIINRESLMDSNLESFMQSGIKECLKSGVGFVGAISSHGYDLEILNNSPLRVLYFNEAIGSKIEILDYLFQNFLERLDDSKKAALKNPKLIPAVAIHSPYSVHPKLLENVLDVTKEQNLKLSVHFLESTAEKEWLESNSGYFKGFFEKFFNTKTNAFYKPLEFLEHFREIRDLYFVHALEAKEKELDFIKELGAKIISCPKSNRLLNSKFLDLSALNGIPLCFGTDGKSSNDSLNLLDELRIALFAYANMPLESLAKSLLLGVTSNAFLNSDLKLGVLKEGNFADFAIFKLPKMQEFLAYNFILYAKEAKALYIDGKEVLEQWKN